VIWGIVLQLILGLLILRTEPGKTTFSFLGKQVEHFQSHVSLSHLGPSILLTKTEYMSLKNKTNIRQNVNLKCGLNEQTNASLKQLCSVLSMYAFILSVILSGTPASFITKTGCHDIAETLLKVALNIKNQSDLRFSVLFLSHSHREVLGLSVLFLSHSHRDIFNEE
jgi:hypothetical protein